jgi:secreted PhoX family phosphatase
MGTEDGSAVDSQLFMYVGKKTTSGTFADKAGLTNGDVHVMSIPVIANDNAFRAKYGKNNPVAVEFKKTIWNADQATQQADHRDKGTEMSRVEDGEWDASNPNVFYFITTESNKDAGATKANPAEPAISRDGGALWRLTFVDGQKPELGAKLELLLDGSEAPYLSKPDNLALTANGIVMIQEDPGNNAHVSRIVAFRPSDKKIAVVAEFNKAYFAADAAQFMTIDEESSGIIDVTKMLAKSDDKNTYFFLNAQVHTNGGAVARPDIPSKSEPRKLAIDKATIEGGAYYLMTISDWNAVFTN